MLQRTLEETFPPRRLTTTRLTRRLPSNVCDAPDVTSAASGSDATSLRVLHPHSVC